MKTVKFILLLFATLSIISCNDNQSDPQLSLTTDNLAGLYHISNVEIDSEISAITSGVSVTISNATSVGDTFQVDFDINPNGTYTMDGQYRVVTTITPIGADPITNSEIIIVNDAGSYSLNPSENTITFLSQNSDFLEGTFNVTMLDETSFSISQQIEQTEGSLSSSINANASFERQ